MKNLVVVFFVTAGISVGLVYAATSGVFDVSTKVNPRLTPAGEDPRTPDEIRKEVLQQYKEAKKNGTIKTDGQTQSPDFRQGPDLAPAVIATSPEEAANAIAPTPTPAPANAPALPPAATATDNAAPEEAPKKGLTKDRIKEIAEQRNAESAAQPTPGPTVAPVGRGTTIINTSPNQ